MIYHTGVFPHQRRICCGYFVTSDSSCFAALAIVSVSPSKGGALSERVPCALNADDGGNPGGGGGGSVPSDVNGCRAANTFVRGLSTLMPECSNPPVSSGGSKLLRFGLPFLMCTLSKCAPGLNEAIGASTYVSVCFEKF